MPPRVLILSASVGAGHLRAAQAVELALRERRPDAVVQNVDVLEVTNRGFRQMYGKAYLDLVNKAPYVLGYIYDYLDKPAKKGKFRRSDRLRRAWQWLNLRKFSKFLRAEPWDLAINTHFLPAEIIAALRADGKLDLPQVTVTTDFETHRLWVNQPCERYFTATEEGALYLHSFGVPSESTRVTGIPIHPNFAGRKTGASVSIGTAWSVIAPSSCNSPAASASGRSPSCSNIFSVSDNHWRSWSSPAATRKSASNWPRSPCPNVIVSKFSALPTRSMN